MTVSERCVMLVWSLCMLELQLTLQESNRSTESVLFLRFGIGVYLLARSSASSAPTEPCSTSFTESATGTTTWTARQHRGSMTSTMISTRTRTENRSRDHNIKRFARLPFQKPQSSIDFVTFNKDTSSTKSNWNCNPVQCFSTWPTESTIISTVQKHYGYLAAVPLGVWKAATNAVIAHRRQAVPCY